VSAGFGYSAEAPRRNIASMRAAAARLVRRAAEVAASPTASDDDRLASGLFLLVTGSGAAAALLWAVSYALLGRPLSAAIPGGFAVVAALMCWRIVRTRDLGSFAGVPVASDPAAAYPASGQPGGLCQRQRGCDVVILRAPQRPHLLRPPSRLGWLAGFIAVVGISAIFDAALAQSVRPLPAYAQTALFAFNLCGVAAVVTLVLAYFRIQRDQAMERSERLLLNVLPPEIAERLKRQEYPIADRFDAVTILFADMVGFTERSAAESPDVTVGVLNEFLTTFDNLAQRHGLRPIRTTGDSYLVVGGLPVPRPDHAEAGRHGARHAGRG
jgi:uncharacterized membrane protein YedE/YeeE